MNKKFQLKDLFSSYAQFCNSAPGADTSADFDSLRGSAVAARKRIVAIIGGNTFFDIVAIGDEDSCLKDFLRAAMANLTLATQIIFDAVNRRKNEVNLYKYELEGMKRSYMENYFNAMDSLISELTEEISDDETAEIRLAMEDWRKTNYCRMLSQLKVDTADEFDEIYPIDLSYLFFFRCVPLQKEVLDESTIDANQRFFASRDDVPRYALTMGMGNILRAKKLLMIVSGHKEDAMRRLLLSERIDPHCPATFLRLHRDAVVLLERSLADAIGYKA